MNIDNGCTCPNCETLLEKGECVCQNCGQSINLGKKEE